MADTHTLSVLFFSTCSSVLNASLEEWTRRSIHLHWPDGTPPCVHLDLGVNLRQSSSRGSVAASIRVVSLFAQGIEVASAYD